MKRLSHLMLVVLLGACAGDLESGSLLERPRVLGVRVEIDGAPERASPAPGEDVTLRWLVASPQDVPWTAAMRVCVGAPSQLGFAGCAGEPFFTGAVLTPSLEPTVTMTLPGAEAFEGLPGDLLLFGVFCAGGTPSMDGCSDESVETELVTFSFPASLGREPANLHPSITDETFTYDEMPWDAPTEEPVATSCASSPDNASFPHVRWRAEGDEPHIGVTSHLEDREPYIELVFGETLMRVESREELNIAHTATAGRIARPNSEVYEDATLDIDVPWRHPEESEVPADGLTVKFIFVMRDGRGGMDWAHRSLCLLP